MNETQEPFREVVAFNATSGRVHIQKSPRSKSGYAKMICGVSSNSTSTTAAPTIDALPPNWRRDLCPRCEKGAAKCR